MHARHRNPGNGYRSSPMGMGGLGPASRISPDGAVRGNASYNSEYRSYNRGFGRGQPKPFQPPQPPPRKGDVFMEAGRLATEYLVSKGILPPSVYSGKWQNGGLKNQAGRFQGFRRQDVDAQAESRQSALARLGDAAYNEMGAGSKKRFPDEYNPTESRNYMRGKRTMGSFKDYGPELKREYGRSASWSVNSEVSPDKNGNDDAFYGYQAEQQVSICSGSGEQKSQSGEIASKTDTSGNPEPPGEKCRLPDDVDSKASISTTGQNLPSQSDLESAEKSKDMESASLGTGEVKDDKCDKEIEKQGPIKELCLQHCEEDNSESRNGNDLLSLCTFAKVPTRTRSSLTAKASKVGSVSVTEDKNINESRLTLGSGALVEARSFNSSLGDASSEQNQCLKTDSDTSEVQLKEDAEDLGITHALGHENCTRSKSFPDSYSKEGEESSEGALGFGRCSSMAADSGEKRSLEHSDSRDGFKKAREWAPMVDTRADNCLYLSNSAQNLQSSHEGKDSPGEEVNIAAERKKLLDISLSPNGSGETCLEYTEEKQLFPGSFKICDLNLMEASDPHENHDDRQVLAYPSVPHGQKEAGHMDIDLSISNSCMMPDKFCRRGANGKEVEVIDLENDSVQDNKALNNPDQKDESLFTGLDSLTSSVQNVNDISGVQDGYGLMISELLGTDMPNCSVPPDVNSLQSEMSLNNGEEILGDDDSIYMSLGEIPISFLRGWEQ